MRALLFPLSSFKVITRITICLLLLALFVPAGGSSSTQGENTAAPLRLRAFQAAGIPSGAWQAILRSIQAERAFAAAGSPDAPARLLNPRLQATDQWLQSAQLLPEDPQAGLSFGCSVAVDGDLVVVGAYWDHRLETGGGAAYLFRKPASGWAGIHQIAKLTPSDPGFHDVFGWSVDIYGNDIVVGAPRDDAGKGSAYVFAQPLGGWRDTTELAKLTASDRDWSDEFGRTVAFSGYATIVVGAPFDDVGAETDHGSVYIFNRSGGAWLNMTESARFYTTDGAAGDMFGAALAADEDTIVAGAYAHRDGDVIGVGQAYVYLHSSGWANRNQDARLLASDGADHEYFGWSVAVDGDVIMVGAPGEDTFDSNGEESAYVFLRPPGDWAGELTEDARLTASDGAIGDDFSTRVAVDGDVIAVAAGSVGISGGSALGAVYAYRQPGGGWVSGTETDKLIASGDEYDEDFAACLAVQEGVILAGAPKFDVPDYVDNGTLYVFTPQAAPSVFLHLPAVIKR